MTNRLANAFMTGEAQSRGRLTPQLDPRFGGQNGWAMNLDEWPSTTHYMRPNVVCKLLRAPLGFAYLDSKRYNAALAALFETHMQTWDGLNSTLTVETEDTPVGHAGEVFQDVTKVSRARTELSSEVFDLYGRPFQNLLEDWILYLIGDPDTGIPALSMVDGVEVGDWLADMRSATLLFYEPDPTHRRVEKAWLSTNVMPLSGGDLLGKREVAAAKEKSNLSVTWTSITQTGYGVKRFAQSLLDRVNLVNANPMMRAAFMSDVDARVAAALGQGDFNANVAVTAAKAVMAT